MADYTEPDDDDTEDDGELTPKARKSIHKTALERFKIAEAAYADQARRELDDLKFASRIDQWTKAERDARGQLSAGDMNLPARVCLTVDKLRQPIQQLENQQRQANLAVDVHPSGGDATLKTAEVIQGLYRHIQVTSRADQIARFWAYSRAIKVGRGCYRVEKVYAHENPKSDDPARFDQELKISRILNQAGVLLDPFAQEPDWSDGEWAFIKAWVPHSRYKRDHPTSEMAPLSDDDDFTAVGSEAPNWVKRDGDVWSVLEVEYWYTQFGAEETLDGPDGQSRKVRKKTVYCCKLNAKEVYDRVEWDGCYIPIIPVVANEENIDGDRIWEGIVAPAKDSQRTYNFMTSAFVETVALAPKAPWLVTVEQMGPYRSWWDQSNVRNFPFLPYVHKSEGQNPAPPPQRMFGEPPIQAIAQGIHQFDADINATTGFFDPSRGNLSSGERSGVALQALQKQSETGNSGYLDNLAQISMTYESKVILDLIPKVYDRPGRIQRILGMDDAPQNVMLNAPYVEGKGKRPIEAPEGADTSDVIEHRLTEGTYDSVVTIGKAYTAARQESAELIGQIIQAEPQLLTVIGDLWFKNLDGPGMPELAERMKKMLPQQLQEPADGQKPDAAALQKQLQQMQEHVKQLQPLADANQAKLQQAQMEAQTKLQQSQLDAASREKIAQLENDTKRQIEQIKADAAQQQAQLSAMSKTNVAAGQSQSDLQKAAMQEDAETQRQRMQQAHDAAAHVIDLHHEVGMAHTAHQQDMNKAHFDVATRPEVGE